MTTTRFLQRRRAGQGGFTLVELLVAVALGLLIMIALIAVYLNVTRTNTEMAKTNSLIENGRFSIDIVSDDLAHAGFWGGYVPLFDNYSVRNEVPTDAPLQASLDQGPCLAYASWDDNYRAMLVGIPVEVYAGVPPDCDAVVTDHKAGTHVLVVRHADTCLPGEPNCDAYNANRVHFQASFCAAETGATPAVRYVLYNNPTNDASLFQLKQRNCTGVPPATVGTVAPVRRFVSNIYYIRTWSTQTGGVKDNIPALVRVAYTASGAVPGHETTATPLIDGIEHMVIELGLDAQTRCGGAVDYTKAIKLDELATGGNLVVPSTCAYDNTVAANNTLPLVRGDGVPESYLHCGAGGCTADQLRDVVSVKLYMLARSRETASGFLDTKTYTLGTVAPVTVTPAGDDRKYKRQVFQTAVRLTNVSGRRETP